jgi:acid phosphatase
MTGGGRRRAVLACSAALLMGACGGGRDGDTAAPVTEVSTSATPTATPTPTPTPAPTPTPSPTAPAPTPAAVADRVDKVLVLVVENHSLDQMRSGMPWTYDLATRYGHAADYHALTHPSLPNYLAIAGGDTFGIADDRTPAAHRLGGPTVFGQALASGRTAGVYAEGMPSACSTADRDRYAVRHNPWTYFADERAGCSSYDVPLTALGRDVADGTLPAVAMAVPDLCNDAHDCGLDAADRWMRDVVGAVLAGPDWKSGRLAVVITADEDDKRHDNLVLTAVLHPALDHVVVGTRLDHYSLSRALSEVAGAPPLRNAAAAPSLLAAFGLVAGDSPGGGTQP